MKRTPLQRKTGLRSTSLLNSTMPHDVEERPAKRQTLKRAPISPASPEQRSKVKGEPCVRCGFTTEGMPVDPAHLCARGQGGCDDPLCVVPLCRTCHQELDSGGLSILEYLVGRFVPELEHALGHYEGNLIGLLQRLTGDRYVPDREAA